MTEKEKQELEARRKEAAIKNMYYTRYFSVRYATAFFFFANLYWMLILYLSKAGLVLLLPLLLTVLAALAMWEQTRMYSVHQKEATLTLFFYNISALANVLLLIIVFVGQYHFLFPFFSISTTTVTVLTVVLLLGLLLAILMLRKLSRIHHHTDKQYKRIQEYIATVQR
ncbi:hypothetical protein OJ610_07170 [Streptococcus anginosus]|uniref:hypothetical protein n=1 Tax=Streptococcus TaxID=1301 RepID=UPI00216AAFD3|nr:MULTISPECIES: hypothetical protein [Streptococcus]MCW1052608.1 hypothetical protein [Streptococcus anginosus]